MNEHLEAGLQCFRIIREHEKAPKKCPQTAEGAALLAYRCPSGQWTIGFGCSFWENGNPVREGDELLEESRIEALLEANIVRAEEYVRKWVRVPLSQYQFDALVSFRFNTRETTLRNSTRLLPAINRQEWDTAAIAFTEFVYGSSKYKGQGDEVARDYQEALRGLLRRRLSEAVVFLGYDWADAVKDTDVALPCDRKLMPSGIYRDVIRSDGLTTLAHVLPIAKKHPLPAIPVTRDTRGENLATQPAVKAPMSMQDAQGGDDELVLSDPVTLPTDLRVTPEASPDVGETSSVPYPGPGGVSAPPSSEAPPTPASVESSRVGDGEKGAAPVTTRPPLTPVGTKPIDPDTKAFDQIPYGVDPTAGAKPMEKTERFMGSAVMLFATVLRSVMSNVRTVAGAGGSILTTGIVGFLAIYDNPDTRAILIAVTVAVVAGIICLITTIGVWIAKVMHAAGLRTKRRGETTATQLTY